MLVGYDSCQAVVRQSSGIRQEVVRQTSGIRQAVVRHSSGIRQAFIRYSIRQAVVMQFSVSSQAVLR